MNPDKVKDAGATRFTAKPTRTLDLYIEADAGRYASSKDYIVRRTPQIPWLPWRIYCVILPSGAVVSIQAETEHDFAEQLCDRLHLAKVRLKLHGQTKLYALHETGRQAA